MYDVTHSFCVDFEFAPAIFGWNEAALCVGGFGKDHRTNFFIAILLFHIIFS